MAKNKITYSEPADYFPKEIRKMFETESKKKESTSKKKKVAKKGKK